MGMHLQLMSLTRRLVTMSRSNSDVCRSSTTDVCRRYSEVSADLLPVVASLTSKRKHVPHWYLYDTRGSEIYEEMARKSSAYTLWNHEYSLLQSHVQDIVSKMASPSILVELGSGASSKTRPVIEAMLERQGTLTYFPVDIAKDYIEEVSRELERDYSALTVQPFGGCTGMDGFRHVAGRTESKLLLFLGSSFGNVPINEQLPMMREIRARFSANDRFVLGLDMNTDGEAVIKAYRENSISRWLDNFVDRLNTDFGRDMDKTKFEKTVDFVQNPAEGDTPSYTQLYLKSCADQRLNLRKLGLIIDFPAGERIHIAEGPNCSCKYNEHQVRRLAERSNFAVEGFWANKEAKYCLVCLAPNEEASA